MGVTRTGRFAAITNFREPDAKIENAPSRGLLVGNFLDSDVSPRHYLEQIRNIGHRFNGFNLLAGNTSHMFYYSNKGSDIQEIQPGLYGLSNHFLDTPWHKVEKGKSELNQLFSKQEIDFEDIFHVLGDRSYPSDDKLPDTGVGYEWEKMLSPLFVFSKIYGTRSSSIVLMERTGTVIFAERTFFPKDNGNITHETRKFISAPVPEN